LVCHRKGQHILSLLGRIFGPNIEKRLERGRCGEAPSKTTGNNGRLEILTEFCGEIGEKDRETTSEV
jgi:hypothetical protein